MRLLSCAVPIVMMSYRLSTRTVRPQGVKCTMRQSLAPLVCETYHFCIDCARMQQQGFIFQTFDNFARPCRRLRMSLHLYISHGAIHPPWCPQTPAMDTCLSNQVWTFRELLTAKVEPLDLKVLANMDYRILRARLQTITKGGLLQ
jgi:hypothetical protein